MLRSAKNPSPTIPCADEASEPKESASSIELITNHDPCDTESVIDEQSTPIEPAPSDDTIRNKDGPLITDTMVQLEKKMEAKALQEDAELQEKRKQAMIQENSERRALHHQRLRFLLSRSQAYSKYLASRIDSQKQILADLNVTESEKKSSETTEEKNPADKCNNTSIATGRNNTKDQATEETAEEDIPREKETVKTAKNSNSPDECDTTEQKTKSDTAHGKADKLLEEQTVSDAQKSGEVLKSPGVGTRRSLRSRSTATDDNSQSNYDTTKDLTPPVTVDVSSPRTRSKSIAVTPTSSQQSVDSQGSTNEGARQTRSGRRLSKDEESSQTRLGNSREGGGTPKQTGPSRRGQKRKGAPADITEIFEEALERNKKQKLDEGNGNNLDNGDSMAISAESSQEDSSQREEDSTMEETGSNAISASNDASLTSTDPNLTAVETNSTPNDINSIENGTNVIPKDADTTPNEKDSMPDETIVKSDTVTTSTVSEPTTTAAVCSSIGSEQVDTSITKLPQRVINGERVHPSQPSLLTGGVLRKYQIEGFKWLQLLYENGVNGILADEMGLGKTIQCIASIADLVNRGVPGPFLICAPLSTVPNWVAEFSRFAPKVPVILYHGNKDERALLRRRIYRSHYVRPGVTVQPVVVTSFEMTMNDRAPLSQHIWKYVIVDEGHRIKNCRCRLVKELKMYKSTHKLLLTGTPLQNNLTELWSLLHFLLPEIFDQLSSFQDFLNVAYLETLDGHEELIKEEEQNNVLSMLHEMLSPFILRRLKSDVEIHIPPKREVLVYAPLSELQEQQYRSILNGSIASLISGNKDEPEEVELDKHGRPVRRSRSTVSYEGMYATDDEISSGYDESFDDWLDREHEDKEQDKKASSVVSKQSSTTSSTSRVRLQMRNMMMLLRKCCNHPYLIEHPLDVATGQLCIDPRIVTASGKLMLLDCMLAELSKRGHKVLIFSQMTTILDIIEDYCHLRQFRYCRLDGSTRMDERGEQITEFNSNAEVFIFLLSTRAGGLGINLAAADTVIIYDSDWNPQSDLQAQDRCHRIGQTRPVLVYRFVTAGTVDEKIVERADAKRKLEKLVMHQGKFKSENFLSHFKPITSEEIMDLLKTASYDKVINGQGDVSSHVSRHVISDSDLEKLLDRSDLCHEAMEKKPVDSGDIGSGVAGVYKILDQDDGKMAIGSAK